MLLPLLSLFIWLPILGSVFLFFFRSEKWALKARAFALFMTLICLGLCFPLALGSNANTWEMQWQEKVDWIPALNIHYALGVDGFSIPLIILTCLMTLFVVLASYRSVKTQTANYLAAFLMMQGLMCGVFAATDAILFYSFWEGMLIPMFLIIGIWGGKNRIYATMKFFLYTFLGSVLLLAALIYLHIIAQEIPGVDPAHTFNILRFHTLPLDLPTQKWLFLAFFIAFAVKVPMWPLHTWLPDAHVEAPTGGSVVLAAILLKMGGYGFIRFLLPITPDASRAFSNGVISLSLIAIVYIAVVAIVQKDMKKLIAYSSIAHMGFVTLGIFLACAMMPNRASIADIVLGIQGAMVQMISHGLVSAALFLCVGVLYDRMHTRLIEDYGGVANRMPIFSAFFMLFAMANVGLPGTSGFVGEFLIILSAFKTHIGYAAFAGTILVFGASYTLWMYKRVIFGAISRPAVALLQDIQGVEKTILSLLAAAILWLGIWPAPMLNFMQASTKHWVEQILQSKIYTRSE